MSTTLEVVESILAALSDSTIPIESLTSTAIALSLQCIANANDTDTTHRRDTAGVDSFFWALWDGVYKLAEEGDEGVQERLVTFLKDAKASEAGEQWVVRDVKVGWNTLPLLGDVAKDIWNGPNIPPTVSDTSQIVQDILAGDAPKPSSAPDLFAVVKARQGCLNLQRFAARLWHEVHVDFPRVLALDIVHLGLEVGALEVEAAATWMTIAADDMLRLVNNDPEGTSRWAGWKAAFTSWKTRKCKERRSSFLLSFLRSPRWLALSLILFFVFDTSGRWMRQMEIVWLCDISFPIPVLG
ncbi:hypothetical protein BU17DRAFT_95189 [Hysterangium stoloniferum]|nr:hypothetical protein BU17DRAFT_95189 [Hysterangium stoloniferum]